MDWVQTHSGKKFSLDDPRPEQVCIEDVITSLAKTVRFNGHCKGNYTVLQHSVHVCGICSPPHKLQALLHDAAEAYYGDLVRPVKRVMSQLTRGYFNAWMERIDYVVMQALGGDWPLSAEVIHADDVLLATEARDLMAPKPESWGRLPEPLPEILVPWEPGLAESEFRRLYALYSQPQ